MGLLFAAPDFDELTAFGSTLAEEFSLEAPTTNVMFLMFGGLGLAAASYFSSLVQSNYVLGCVFVF